MARLRWANLILVLCLQLMSTTHALPGGFARGLDHLLDDIGADTLDLPGSVPDYLGGELHGRAGGSDSEHDNPISSDEEEEQSPYQDVPPLGAGQTPRPDIQEIYVVSFRAPQTVAAEGIPAVENVQPRNPNDSDDSDSDDDEDSLRWENKAYEDRTRAVRAALRVSMSYPPAYMYVLRRVPSSPEGYRAEDVTGYVSLTGRFYDGLKVRNLDDFAGSDWEDLNSNLQVTPISQAASDTDSDTDTESQDRQIVECKLRISLAIEPLSRDATPLEQRQAMYNALCNLRDKVCPDYVSQYFQDRASSISKSKAGEICNDLSAPWAPQEPTPGTSGTCESRVNEAVRRVREGKDATQDAIRDAAKEAACAGKRRLISQDTCGEDVTKASKKFKGSESDIKDLCRAASKSLPLTEQQQPKEEQQEQRPQGEAESTPGTSGQGQQGLWQQVAAAVSRTFNIAEEQFRGIVGSGVQALYRDSRQIFDYIQQNFPAFLAALAGLAADGVTLDSCFEKPPKGGPLKARSEQVPDGKSVYCRKLAEKDKPKPKFVFYGSFLWPDEAKKQGGFLPPQIELSPSISSVPAFTDVFAAAVLGFSLSSLALKSELKDIIDKLDAVDHKSQVLLGHLTLGKAAEDAAREASNATEGFHGVVYILSATENIVITGDDAVIVGGARWSQVAGFVQIPLNYTFPSLSGIRDQKHLEQHFQKALDSKISLFQKNPDYDAKFDSSTASNSLLPNTSHAMEEFMNKNGQAVGWTGNFPLFRPAEVITPRSSKAAKEAKKPHEPSFWENVGHWFHEHEVAIALITTAVALLIPVVGEIVASTAIAATAATMAAESLELVPLLVGEATAGEAGAAGIGVGKGTLIGAIAAGNAAAGIAVGKQSLEPNVARGLGKNKGLEDKTQSKPS